MKQMKYLNSVLTIIAICLVVITFAVTDIFPKAYAGDKKFISIPLNPDGSLNVKIMNSTVDVNIEEVGGFNTFGTVPVELAD